MAQPPLILIVDDNLDARELFLMDATMPRMDGWEAVRLLKEDEATRHIPLIMLTAHAFDEHRERAKKAGADGFLAKPVLPDALAREIGQFLKL